MTAPSDPPRGARRFYAEVTVVDDGQGGHAIRLDGRAPRSPAGRPLILPTRPLADLIAAEWRAQGETVNPATMPATRLAHTALDLIPKDRGLGAEGVTRFAGADLICYFATSPGRLVRRQEEVWGPLLDWARDAHGLAFTRAVGIIHQDQPPETLARLGALLATLDDFALAGLAFAAPLFGSAILALALWSGRLDAAAAMAAARLDEDLQAELWGIDAEAKARSDALAVEAAMAEAWFAALRA
jgi:chaperone required for assembly of F1-ATPase